MEKKHILKPFLSKRAFIILGRERRGLVMQKRKYRDRSLIGR